MLHHIVENATCPTCDKPVNLDQSNKWRPFCSERCKLIDLGAWVDESHRIPGEETIHVEHEEKDDF